MRLSSAPRCAAASLETVLRTNSADSMRVHRHDIPHPGADGEFVPRVTDVSSAILELARAIDTATKVGSEVSSRQLTHTLAAFTAALPRDRSQTRALAKENDQLRRALETRDVIGQAKGVLMERFNTDAERAFEILVKLSQDSNTRVEGVARRLIEVEHPPQPL